MCRYSFNQIWIEDFEYARTAIWIVHDIHAERAYPTKLPVGYIVGPALFVMNSKREKLLRINEGLDWIGTHLSPLPAFPCVTTPF